MKLYTEELYSLYMKWVDNVPDEKSIFTPKEIVNAIANIIETNPSLIELPSRDMAEEAFTNLSLSDSKEGKIDFLNGFIWTIRQILNQTK